MVLGEVTDALTGWTVVITSLYIVYIFNMQIHIQYIYGECVFVLNHFSRVQFFENLDYSSPSSSVHGILQAAILEEPWLPPGDLPNPEIQPEFLTFPALAGRFFSFSATWDPHVYYKHV